jgi:uncharacterized membrane protein YvlD (DUF360 family)
MSFLLNWFILAVAFWLTARFLDGLSVRDFTSAMIAAGLFGLLNFFIGWVIFIVFGLATLGIGFLLAFVTRLFVDAVILKLVDGMTDRIRVKSFLIAVWASVLISLFGTVGQWLVQSLGIATA